MDCLYILTTKEGSEVQAFCNDRKWRKFDNTIPFPSEKKTQPKLYNAPNNATTMGNRLKVRNFINNYEVIPL